MCPAGRSLEGFIPKSAKDFEEFGRLVAGVHLLPHSKSAHYKASLPPLLASVLLCCWSVGEPVVAGVHRLRADPEVALQGEGRGCRLECCHSASDAADTACAEGPPLVARHLAATVTPRQTLFLLQPSVKSAPQGALPCPTAAE